MERRLKFATATLKSAPTDGSGTFIAVVSTIGGPPDAQGDIISEGAFDATINDASVRHQARCGLSTGSTTPRRRTLRSA